MNGYIALFNGKQHEIYAKDLWAAKQAALAYFKPAKSKAHLVSVTLCELEGKEVVHIADF